MLMPGDRVGTLNGEVVMEFWIRQTDQGEWRSIPLRGATLPAGDYAILTRSPQPHFTISVDVYQYSPHSEDKVLHQQGFTRTNEEGLGEILPLTALEPGRWELHCRDGDLIAELFGENQSDVLCFEILPAETHNDAPVPLSTAAPAFRSGRGVGSSPEFHPEEHPQAPAVPSPLMAAPQAWDPLDSENEIGRDQPLPPEDPAPLGAVAPESPALASSANPPFSLMHSRLQGAPGEVLVLTGRIECSGDLEARVYNQKQLVFENQRTIRLPGDARSAVFSIQVPLPSSPWPGTLIGTLTLRGLTDGSHSSLTFTVSCLEQKNGVGSAAPLRSPLLSKAPQEIPINQYRDSLAPAVDASDQSPGPQTEGATPSGLPRSPIPLMLGADEDLSGTDTLFAARTLRRMRQLCQEELAPDPRSTAILEPEYSAQQELIPDPEPDREAYPVPTSEIHTASQTAEVEMAVGGSGRTEVDLLSEAVHDPGAVEAQDHLWEPETATEDPFDAAFDPGEEELGEEPDPSPMGWSVVSTPPRGSASPGQGSWISRDPAPAQAGIGEPSRFRSATSPQDLPLPEIWVPEQIQAGETVDITLRLQPLEETPLWIKLWLKQDRTRSILDGPRWLLDFTRTDQGYLQAITRLTIPHGSGEIVFEAWAVTSDLLHQGERTLLRRSIR